jgi:hypothetical protein
MQLHENDYCPTFSVWRQSILECIHVLRKLTTFSTWLIMTTAKLLFAPRKQGRIQSWKRTTVRTREYEYKREGLSAATLKIKSKWRLRKHRAKKYLRALPDYVALQQLAPQLCESYFKDLDAQFNGLRESELRKGEALWELQQQKSSKWYSITSAPPRHTASGGDLKSNISSTLLLFKLLFFSSDAPPWLSLHSRILHVLRRPANCNPNLRLNAKEPLSKGKVNLFVKLCHW